MSIKRIGMGMVAAVAAIALTACSGGSGGGSNGANERLSKTVDVREASYDELKDGGTLTLALAEIPDQLNPFHQDATGTASTLWYWYNPQVILFDKDQKVAPNPAYVTDIKDEVKDNKTVVTYTLNKDAKFNDGTPIDVKAFETTWKINSGESKDYAPSATDGYQDIESLTASADGSQVIVTFKRIFPWWGGLFGMLAHPKLADPEFYKTGYLKQGQPDLGAGPYKLEKFDPQAGVVTYVPNEKWWGQKGKLERVTLRYMDDQASINAFKNGELDATGVGSKDRLAQVKDMSGIKLYKALLPWHNLLMLNAKSEILSDIKVREAFHFALDRAQIAKIRFDGLDFTEPLPGSLVLFSNQPDYEDIYGSIVKFDPEHAKKLLDEAGWKEGADGIREKDGKKLALKYPNFGESPVFRATALAEQKMMKDVGIDLQVEERSSKDFSQIYTQREFDVFSLAFATTDPFGPAYFGQTYESDSGLNLSGTGTPAFDEKIKELQSLPTAEEQIKRSNELEKEALAQFGIIPLYNGPQIGAVKEGLANYGATGISAFPKEMIGWVK